MMSATFQLSDENCYHRPKNCRAEKVLDVSYTWLWQAHTIFVFNLITYLASYCALTIVCSCVGISLYYETTSLFDRIPTLWVLSKLYAIITVLFILPKRSGMLQGTTTDKISIVAWLTTCALTPGLHSSSG